MQALVKFILENVMNEDELSHVGYLKFCVETSRRGPNDKLADAIIYLLESRARDLTEGATQEKAPDLSDRG